jgi:hypothetical protein
MRQCSLGAKVDAIQINRQHRAPIRRRGLSELLQHAHTCVGDKDIEFVKSFDRCGYHSLNRSKVTDVARMDERARRWELGRNFLQLFAPPTHQCHIGALATEAPRDGGADAGARSCSNDGLAVEAFAHLISSFDPKARLKS